MAQSPVMLFLVLATLIHVPQFVVAVSAEYPEDLVKLLAGTDTPNGESVSTGNTLPQIKVPWGFNDWAPQTNGAGGAWWFRRNDDVFQGMRCTHQPSPWIGDYGHFLLLPHTENVPTEMKWSVDDSDFRPYLFNTSVEGIQFEFVPTSHAAIARVTFPKTATRGHFSLATPNGEVSSNPEGTILRGRSVANSGGVPDGWNGIYFTLQSLSPTLGAHDIEDLPSEDHSNGMRPQRGTFEFASIDEPILLAVATSFISQDQADLNLQEVISKSFKDVLKESRGQWAEQLGRVQIEALDDNQLSVFYTNLWKSMLFPRFLHEVDAEGREVHLSPYTNEVSPGKLVADSGFWDSYLTVYQLQSMVFPDTLGPTIDGWVNAYKEAKWLPQWPSPGQHNSMVGTMGDVVLADAIAKHKWGLLNGFDVEEAYNAIRKDAFTEGEGWFGREGLKEYIHNGYLSHFSHSMAVSRTMHYYVSDAAIARAAAILGKQEDEDVLRKRSKRYDVLFNKDTHFFAPKDSRGSFLQYNPRYWGTGFTESGGWQYRFYVPHDVEGLSDIYEGQLCSKIQQMMEYTSGPAFEGGYDQEYHEIRELQATQREFGLYMHSNQPVHHVLYVAKKAGCNEVADKYLRKVMDKLYTTKGWSGDEDNGEMASWYVLSALGIYSLEGAKDEVVLGSPAIKHAVLKLPSNKELTVKVENQAPENVYVRSVRWTPDGGSHRTITDNVLPFTELMRGGRLSFLMSASPQSSARLRGTKPHPM